MPGPSGYDPSLGELRRGPFGRWVLNGQDLTSGSHFQVRIAHHWIDVVIEHNGEDYYAIPPAVRLFITVTSFVTLYAGTDCIKK